MEPIGRLDILSDTKLTNFTTCKMDCIGKAVFGHWSSKENDRLKQGPAGLPNPFICASLRGCAVRDRREIAKPKGLFQTPFPGPFGIPLKP
jgi:hypothetical protein